jgi:hypothetical protein
MQKLLGVYILAIVITCGLAFEGPSALSAPGSAAAPCPVGNSAEIHYALDEDLESIDVALVGEAVKQIDMAAYVLTDRAVIEALRQAAVRGVKVRIWRDPGMAVRVGEADVQAQLAGRLQGIEIRPNPPDADLESPGRALVIPFCEETEAMGCSGRFSVVLVVTAVRCACGLSRTCFKRC